MPIISNNLTTSGEVVVANPSKMGAALWIDIGHTERRFDTTAFASEGYPMNIELEARGQSAYIKQGDSTVTLTSPSGLNGRLAEGDFRVITVSNPADAYIALRSASNPVTSGEMVAIRIDKLT